MKNKKIVDRIIRLVDRIIKAKEKNFNANTSKLEIEINNLVYELYGLSKAEVRVIRYFAQKRGGLTDETGEVRCICGNLYTREQCGNPYLRCRRGRRTVTGEEGRTNQ